MFHLNLIFAFLRCLTLFAVVFGTAGTALAVNSYIYSTDGKTVTDLTTDLIWTRCVMGQNWDGTTCSGTAVNYYGWDTAKVFVGTVVLDGQSDWRLPTIRELQTIVDRSADYPIDSVAFPNSHINLWSSTLLADDYNNAWITLPNYNYTYDDPYTWGYYGAIRLVRGQPNNGILNVARPNTDYVRQNNGSVTHNPTGLTWQPCAIGQSWTGSTCYGTESTFTLGQAKLLTSNFSGKTDWRLPTIDELLSLVDYSSSKPAINTTLFPNTSSVPFASVSPYSYSAWYVGFFDGRDFHGPFRFDDRNAYQSAVRLVRGGKSNGPLVLNVSTIGSGQTTSDVMPGIECGNLCSGGFNSGKTVTLTATPAVDFITWSGDCSGTSPTCIVVMDASKSVIATFKRTPSVATFNFITGWNLLGNGTDQTLDIASLFGDPFNVLSVWKRNEAGDGWEFYAPAMSESVLKTYANSQGYSVLSSIKAGEGFWVYASHSFSKDFPNATTVTANTFQLGKPSALKQGWNLIALGDELTPSAFNVALSTEPPNPNDAPMNITSLWAWDSQLAKWYFYSPDLAGQGEAALLNETISKGYLDFASTGKLLTQGIGFWVKK